MTWIVRYASSPVWPLIDQCLDKGMIVYIKKDDEDLPAGAWPRWVWSGPAIYIPYLRTLAMSKEISEGTHTGYDQYGGDLHELGHAVWFLLLTSWERYTKYPKLYGFWSMIEALIPYGEARPNIEESWAQDFEAFWTADTPYDPVGWGRQTFRKLAPKRFEFMAYTLRRLGADVDRLVKR